MVKTRTVVQTRTHAQKYFQKVSKSGGGEDSENDQDGTDETPMPKVAPLVSDRSVASSDCSNSPSKVCIESPKLFLKKGQSGLSGGAHDSYPLKSVARSEGPGRSGKQSAYDYYPYTIPYSDGYPPVGYSDTAEKDQLPLPPNQIIGKRKHFELTAAEVMAAASYPPVVKASPRTKGPRSGPGNWDYPYKYPGPGPHVNGIDQGECHKPPQVQLPLSLSCESLIDMEGEGAQVLFMMSEMNETNLNTPTEPPKATHCLDPAQTLSSNPPVRSVSSSGPKSLLSLSISNPESINHSTGGSENHDAPDTPWESEVRALEARTSFMSRTACTGESENSDSTNTMRFCTPTEQRDFLKEVMALLDRGYEGLPLLESLLDSAASQCSEDSDGESSNGGYSSGDNHLAVTLRALTFVVYIGDRVSVGYGCRVNVIDMAVMCSAL